MIGTSFSNGQTNNQNYLTIQYNNKSHQNPNLKGVIGLHQELNSTFQDFHKTQFSTKRNAMNMTPVPLDVATTPAISKKKKHSTQSQHSVHTTGKKESSHQPLRKMMFHLQESQVPGEGCTRAGPLPSSHLDKQIRIHQKKITKDMEGVKLK